MAADRCRLPGERWLRRLQTRCCGPASSQEFIWAVPCFHVCGLRTAFSDWKLRQLSRIRYLRRTYSTDGYSGIALSRGTGETIHFWSNRMDATHHYLCRDGNSLLAAGEPRGHVSLFHARRGLLLFSGGVSVRFSDVCDGAPSAQFPSQATGHFAASHSYPLVFHFPPKGRKYQ